MIFGSTESRVLCVSCVTGWSRPRADPTQATSNGQLWPLKVYTSKDYL
jgi:hypothetical protein